jgi:putative endonuclease
MKWFVYILKCKDSSLYTGITTDLKRRFEEHRSGKGAGYTRSHMPVKMVHFEKLGTRSAALKREAKIKKMTRQDKIALVKAN